MAIERLMSFRLDVDAVLAGRPVAVRAPTSRWEHVAELLRMPPITCRQWLTVVGATGVALPPVLAALNKSDACELLGDERLAVFARHGRALWVIDPQRFDGAPRLRIRRSARSIYLSLQNAYFPATHIPASFRCPLQQSPSGWRMRLGKDFRQLNGNAAFVPWLEGHDTYENLVRGGSTRIDLEGGFPC
jgi:hypothetical protein